MKKFRWLVIPLVLGMLLASMNVAMAQSVDTTPPAPAEDPGTLPPTTDPTPTYNINPIVKLLAQFFSLLFAPVATETPTTTEPAPTDEIPTEETPIVTPPPLALLPEEQVAAYHAEGLGFGVLVKLFSIASAAQEQCKLDGTLCDVTVDSLIAQVQAGVGIGQIEAQYGKPTFLGIGHIKNANAEEHGKGKGKNK